MVLNRPAHCALQLLAKRVLTFFVRRRQFFSKMNFSGIFLSMMQKKNGQILRESLGLIQGGGYRPKTWVGRGPSGPGRLPPWYLRTPKTIVLSCSYQRTEECIEGMGQREGISKIKCNFKAGR